MSYRGTDDLVTVNEAAALKGVSRHTIYSAIREETLSSVRVLGKIAVHRADLESLEVRERGRPKKVKNEGKIAP